nr:hypothetical protein B0A51_00409 [Rachicladosporium sp. CCFEE 5018]
MAQPDVSDGKHADLEAKAEAEHEVEIKRLDEDIDKSMANLLKAIQRELTSREWYIWVDERTMVLQIVCNEVAPSRFEAANSQADFCTQDAILHEDIVMYWLGLAKDISELAAKARTVIEYHIGEPEKQKEIIALTADLLRAGEEIGLANTHAAAVKGVAENRVSISDMETAALEAQIDADVLLFQALSRKIMVFGTRIGDNEAAVEALRSARKVVTIDIEAAIKHIIAIQPWIDFINNEERILAILHRQTAQEYDEAKLRAEEIISTIIKLGEMVSSLLKYESKAPPKKKIASLMDEDRFAAAALQPDLHDRICRAKQNPPRRRRKSRLREPELKPPSQN